MCNIYFGITSGVQDEPGGGGKGGGGALFGSIFAGYVPLASQSPCPIIAYFVANYRPHLRASLFEPGYRNGSISGMNFIVCSYGKISARLPG